MDKLQERIKTVRDAAAFKKTDRIPTFSNYWTYMLIDGGYKLNEAIYDLDKMYAAITAFHNKYQFDFYNYLGNRNPFELEDSVDGQVYSLSADGEYLNLKDYHIMNEDEYPLLAADPLKFIWETALPRKCKAFAGEHAYEAFEASVPKYDSYNAFTTKIVSDFVNVLNVPKISQTGLYTIPFDTLTNFFRGLKGMSIDLRRRYSQVIEALDVLAEFYNVQGFVDSILTPMSDDSAFGASLVLLNHGILNLKQWEAIYWPWIKKIVDNCVKTGKQFQLFSEAEVMRFGDFFRDIPKGTLTSQPEMDDVFEMRKLLPNVAICGGMKPDYLGKRSKEECLDYAKKLVDELGANGGFIMGQTKMMSYRTDAKAENIAAVQEFCANYRN